MGVNIETSSLLKQESNANADGLSTGQSATDLIGFYGITTPIARRASAAQAAVTKTITTPAAQTATTPATATSTTPTKTATTVGTTPSNPTTGAIYAYTSALQADSIPTQINAINADLLDFRTQIAATNVDVAAVRAQVAAATVDITALRTQMLAANVDVIASLALMNELRAALVALNLIKGAA